MFAALSVIAGTSFAADEGYYPSTKCVNPWNMTDDWADSPTCWVQWMDELSEKLKQSECVRPQKLPGRPVSSVICTVEVAYPAKAIGAFAEVTRKYPKLKISVMGAGEKLAAFQQSLKKASYPIVVFQTNVGSNPEFLSVSASYSAEWDR
jgi:hypothetical protein